MRSDCLFKCYQQTMRTKCNTTDLIESWNLITSEYLLKNRYQSLSPGCITTKSGKEMIMLECVKSCQYECTFMHYPLQIGDASRVPRLVDTIVNVQHNELPDIKVRQIPEMLFTTLVCNFGGLLGMWMGLSFSTIIMNVLPLFGKIFKLTQHLVIFQNNVSYNNNVALKKTNVI